MNHMRVVVTGMGALTPIGNTVSEFRKGLFTGRSGAAFITKFDTTDFKTKFACEVNGLEMSDFLDRKEIRTNDPYVQFALIAAEEALNNAGLSDQNFDSHRAGVIWGSGNGGIKTFEDEILEYAKTEGQPKFSPYFIPKIIVNMAAGVISIKFGMKGPAFSPVSACATGNTSIIEAMNYIKLGYTDVMIAGGSDAAITKSGIAGFNAIKALSTLNDQPEKACRPFDKDRDGFVMGEGAGALILEDMNHALERGADIYAEVGGGAMTSDAYHLTATHPEGEGAARAMKLTCEMARVSPHQIDYINAHATSTPLGDISELRAISSMYEDQTPSISATKSMTGHLLGAAGAIEAIASILSINYNEIPPTINTENVDENIPANIQLVNGKSLKKEINVALSNTFGFGGHNAAVLFKKFIL